MAGKGDLSDPKVQLAISERELELIRKDPRAQLKSIDRVQADLKFWEQIAGE